jgi:periplasmic copper chaperone A
MKPTMRLSHSLVVLFVGASMLLARSAEAHVTLATQEAPVGAGYKAIFRVPHGCKGSATVKLSVQIPQGVVAVKPQPKPGWDIDIVKGPYDQAYDFYSAKVSEGVKVVTWSNGKLPDEYYDEFVLSGYLTQELKPETILYFPTVQSCETGVDRWIEIPEAGKSARDYPRPAPGVRLLPAKSGSE